MESMRLEGAIVHISRGFPISVFNHKGRVIEHALTLAT